MFITEVSKVHTHTDLYLFIHEAIRTYALCVLSSVATDALFLKHQATSNRNAGEIFIVLEQFDTKILHLLCTISENEITLWKNYSVV